MRAAKLELVKNLKLETALKYAAQKLFIFPIYEMAGDRCSCGKEDCGSPGKHPRTKNGVKDATRDERQIRAWFKKWPNANIACATGEISDRLVIDLDIKSDKDGVTAFTQLSVPHGGWPQTLRSKTGSGGWHLFFRYSPALKTGTDVLAPGIDVRSDGGYVILPPSNHWSGGSYEFEDESVTVLVLPEWVVPPKSKPKSSKRKAGGAKKKLTLEQVKEALTFIDPDNRDYWHAIGVILGRAYNRRDEAWEIYKEWAARSAKFDKPGTDATMREAFYKLSTEKSSEDDDALTLGTLITWAREGGWEYQADSAGYGDFWFNHAAGKFLYVPSGELWTDKSVNAALPPRIMGTNDDGEIIYELPATWLSRERGIESMVWDPALPEINADRVARAQGVIDHPGATLYNKYFPPRAKPGDPKAARMYVDHIRKLFPNKAEANHIIAYIAHLVQRPGVKIRHALVMGGPPGIGKDTTIEGALPALGEWNVSSINPDQIFDAFNEYVACVLLRINEVVDLHEISRYKFYEATKTLIAGNPEYISVNPKYGGKFHVRNCCGVVMTTNSPTDGLYLTADDRRHYVVETIPLWGNAADREKYFGDLYRWMSDGGYAHINAYLRSVDLSGFDPNVPPPKTSSFLGIVANSSTPDIWLAEALDSLEDPEMVRADTLRNRVGPEVTSQEFSRRLEPTMVRLGYRRYLNPTRVDGRHEFKTTNRRILTPVYIKTERKSDLTPKEMFDAMTPPNPNG